MLARIHRFGLLVGTAAALVAASAGCSRPVDLSKAIRVADVTTGWFDAGIVDGKNKLVPTITCTLQNSASQSLNVQMNVMFVILPQKESQDEVFLQNVEVPGGGRSKPITVRAKYGFTGEQPRGEMLQHRLFQDFTVRLFAKQGSSQWTLLGDYPVARQLLTR
jgi:hypothetical protein